MNIDEILEWFSGTETCASFHDIVRIKWLLNEIDRLEEERTEHAHHDESFAVRRTKEAIKARIISSFAGHDIHSLDPVNVTIDEILEAIDSAGGEVMNIDKKIAEIEEWRRDSTSRSEVVEVYLEWLINQLKAHRKVLDDKEDYLLEVYDQLKECKEWRSTQEQSVHEVVEQHTKAALLIKIWPIVRSYIGVWHPDAKTARRIKRELEQAIESVKVK